LKKFANEYIDNAGGKNYLRDCVFLYNITGKILIHSSQIVLMRVKVVLTL